MTEDGTILLTGATGYVGGRLLERLESEGRSVRCLVRRPAFLKSRTGKQTVLVEADLANPPSLTGTMNGIDTAYYLVHSMGVEGSFADADRFAAQNFLAEARRAGLRRIIYLGGLGADTDLSTHLASRQEVGRILRKSGIPTVELRASIVIGSGSLSFEMIRALVDKLPVMITPRWVRTLAQPIAIEDLIEYLRASLDLPVSTNSVIEIGGADRASYGQIMREYSRQRHLQRLMIPVPVLTPRLSSLWLGLITPIYARIGRKLVESLKNETVVRDTTALELFSISPRGLSDAIERTLGNEDHEFATTRWSDAVSSAGNSTRKISTRVGSRLVDSRARHVGADAASAFRPIRRIGGARGWYAANWLWRLRGLLDLMLGGPGMRRGRRNPEVPAVGDTLDFWRVEAFDTDRRLRLFSEMRLPGRAWLQFEVESDGACGSTIRQTAEFEPRGLTGNLYWYAMYPAHQWIFERMLRNIARQVPGSVA